MTIRYAIRELPFEYPFTISKGTKTHQPTFAVELNWRGVRGYGEAPAISYYGITTEKMAQDLQAKRKFIESFSLIDPKRFWHFLHHLFPNNPFLVCALDMAGWDLFSKMRKQPLHALWGLDLSKSPRTDYTIGMDTLEKMLQKMDDHPAPVYKIKAGSKDDLEKLALIRDHTDAKIRIDANAGWSLEETLDYIPHLERMDIELIEQPLPKEMYAETQLVKNKTRIPVIADESCVGQKDVQQCIGNFSGINIKLTKCSGITPALEMIKEARRNGLMVMLGCMNESSIGTAALAHMAPLADFLDADGPLLLQEDLATGLVYDDHRLLPGHLPGLGVIPEESLFD